MWLGILEDDATLRSRFRPIAEKARNLGATGLLRAEAELVVLDPTPRSRLRWLSDPR